LSEKGIKCKIIKYVDRIWLKDDNNNEVMRTFIIEVYPGSTKSLEKFSFIIPRLVKTDNLENLSHDSVNPKSFFNEQGRTTGEIKVMGKNRIIFDGFDCQVYHKRTLKAHDSEEITRIDFDLRDKPIASGKRELFRLRFNVNDLITEAPNVSAFEFNYFAIDERKEDIFLELSAAYDVIPIVPMYKMETLHGGFDFFVYAPPDREIGSPISPYGHASMNYDYKGNSLDKYLDGIVWHLREIIDYPSEEIIWKKSKGFVSRKKIQGTIRTPVQYKDIEELKESSEELKKSSEELKESSEELKKSSGRNLKIGISAVVIGIIAILLSIFLKTPPQ